MALSIARKLARASAVFALLFFLFPLQSTLAGETFGPADDSNAAKNLARMNCGARIDIITPDGRVVAEIPGATAKDANASALIMDDDTVSVPLHEGDTTFIIAFPRTSALDRFTFVNENGSAEGEMKVSVSNYRLPAQSSKWIEVNGSTLFTHQRHFNLSLLGVEARYVKLSFHVQKAGRIAALGLYGAQSLQKFASRQSSVVRVKNLMAARRLEDMLNFNFANLYAKARVVFVSSGAEESARRMIDDDTITAYRFAAADPHPTVIVELAERERLHRISALYKMQAGTLEVFLLDELGSNPGDLSGAKPIASIVDASGGGKAAVNFDPNGGRYVALRWTPSAPEAIKVFEVVEISAFGDMPLSMLSTTEFPDVYASNTATEVKAPEVPVELPVLALVSE
ncbi:MAG: hypothetical protein DLM73_09455 [Chthoniobacterales bacterium]|nr:MAG: hypothetical protein DLM73_09455 [Chthoniobacterales bacterium]